MNVLFWIISLGLAAFLLAARIGKSTRRKMAVEWRKRIGLSEPLMLAFGGLENGIAGVILWSLFNEGDFIHQLVPWACLLLLVLKVVELGLQTRAKESFAAMVGPLFVIALTIGFYFLRKGI
jgi:hypothetical protein